MYGIHLNKENLWKRIKYKEFYCYWEKFKENQWNNHFWKLKYSHIQIKEHFIINF